MQFFRKILLFITFCLAAAISLAQQIKSVSATDRYRPVHLTVQDRVCAYEDGIVWTGKYYADNGVYELLPYNPPVKMPAIYE